jgi:cytochrome c-type biogenesis protein CcmF
MAEVIGNYSLAAAVLTASAAILLAILAARSASAVALGRARWAIVLFTGLLTLAAAALLSALADSDFHFAYVAEHTERSLPLGYKLAAFWAGQAGSLLLWGWMIAALSVLAVFIPRGRSVREQAVTAAALAGVLAFFSALLLFAANPFTPVDSLPDDGQGMNPMLQHWAMILHPPALFLGYAACTIPFAFMLAAVATGQTDDRWLPGCRRWVLLAWLFLTAGIVLGAKWAYVELGWGGYWAWDPVENASLLPWFTATALLHSMMVQQRRGMFRAWNAVLLALTFLMCIFGTYLTRSGVVQSVHSFGASLIGTFFLVFLVLITVGSAALLIVRRRTFRPGNQMECLAGREGAFLASNILLVLMLAATLWGTLYPALSQLFTGQQAAVQTSFYAATVIPLALAELALMSVGPLLTFGKDAGGVLVRRLRVPLMGAAAAVVLAAILGLRPWQALAAVAIAVSAVLCIALDFGAAVLARRGATRENPLAAAAGLLAASHRRYGAQLAHLGAAMLMIGVVGSSLFTSKETIELKPGQSAQVGRYTLTLSAVGEDRQVNFTALDAALALSVPDHADPLRVLHPQVRTYDKYADQPKREVALDGSWLRDVYVVLAGFTPADQTAVFEVTLNPLVVWVWIGALVGILGGVICLLPRLLPLPQTQPVAAPEAQPPKFSRGWHSRATPPAPTPAVPLPPASRRAGRGKIPTGVVS